MAEAMEKWGLDIVKEVLPEIYDIILQINKLSLPKCTQRICPRARPTI